MKNHVKRLVIAASTLTAVLAVSTVLPAYAAEPTDVAHPAAADNTASTDGLEVRIGTEYEDSTVVGLVGDEPGITPYLFDPGDSLNCDLLNDANWTITNYFHYATDHPTTGNSWVPQGYTPLLCGTDTTSGFKHIRYRHQWGNTLHPHSWEAFRQSAIDAGASTAFSWDDYMDKAIKDTLDFPYPYPSDQGNGKACFSVDFYVWVGDEIYSSWYANTILSVNNNRVITAYLSDNNYYSDCDENES